MIAKNLFQFKCAQVFTEAEGVALSARYVTIL
jgi:hypothetical protein